MTDYYISNAGDNGDDGSEGTPWETITYAVANSSSGDTLYLNRGDTWDEGEIAIDYRTIDAYGSGDKPLITKVGTERALALTNSTICNIQTLPATTEAPDLAFVTISACTVQHCDFIANQNKCLTDYGSSIVEDCTFTDTYTSCAQLLTIFQGTDQCIVRRNSFIRTNELTQIGLFVHGDAGSGQAGHIIEDNLFDGQADDGRTDSFYICAISISSDFTANAPIEFRRNRLQGSYNYAMRLANDVNISQNIIDARNAEFTTPSYGTPATIPIRVTSATAIVKLYCCTILINNKVFTGCSLQEPANATVYNNVFHATAASGPFYITNLTTADNGYNYYYGSARGEPGGMAVSSVEGTDPELSDVDADEFWLADGSPCVDAGVAVDGYNSRLRFASSWPDQVTSAALQNIGAYQGETQAIAGGVAACCGSVSGSIVEPVVKNLQGE